MFMLIFALFSLVLAIPMNSTMKGADDKKCDLSCLLSNLKVDMDLNMEPMAIADGFNIELKHIVVNNVVLKSLDSQLLKDELGNLNGFNLFLTINKVHVELDVSFSGTINMDANLQVDLVNDVTAGMDMVFNSYDYKGFNLISEVNPHLTLDIDNNDIQIKADLGSSILNAILNGFINLLKGTLLDTLNDYMGEIDLAIKNAMDPLFANVNANFTQKYIDGAKTFEVPSEGKYLMNLTESAVFNALSWVTTSLLGGNSSLSINSLIDRFTMDTGKLTFDASKIGKVDPRADDVEKFFAEVSDLLMGLLRFPVEIPAKEINGLMNIAITYISIDGLNTWRDMSILDPVRFSEKYGTDIPMCEVDKDCDYQLKIASGLDHFHVDVKFEIDVKADGTMISTAGGTMHEPGEIEIITDDNYLEAVFQLGVFDKEINRYSQLMMKNLTCWTALMDVESTGIPMAMLETRISKVSLAATSASPDKLEQGLNRLINNIATFFIEIYKPAIPSFLNGLVNEFGIGALNDLLNNMKQDYCDENKDPVVLEYVPSVVISSVTIAILIGVILLVICIVFIVIRRRKDNEETVEDAYAMDQKEIEMAEEKEEIKEEEVQVKSKDKKKKKKKKMTKKDKMKEYGKQMGKKVLDKIDQDYCKHIFCSPKWFIKQFLRSDPQGASMFLDRRIPIIFRVIVPVIIILNIGVFLISNTGVGATVNAYIHFSDANLMTLPVSDFGLMSSVRDMWTAGVYPLAILIMVFSGIWPYFKLVLLLLVWMIPITIIKPRFRGAILHFLDAFGKWSFLDSYVMTLMIVAFFFNIPITPQHPEVVTVELFSIKLYVDAALGFILLMVGTLISLLLSHILVFVHDALLKDKAENHGAEAKKWRPMCMYTGNWFTRIIILVGIIISAILVFVGLFIKSFTFDFYGLAGWALGQLGIATKREFSLWDLGVDLPGASKIPDGFNTIFIQAIYFVTVFAMPILHHVVLIIYWCVPLNRRLQYIVHSICDILYAWACMDVFIISVIAAVLELSQFAGFMVVDMCGVPLLGDKTLDNIIGMFFGQMPLVEGHETCFEVAASLESGCWCLFISAVIYTIISWTVSISGKKVLKKRMATEEEAEAYYQKKREEKEKEMESESDSEESTSNKEEEKVTQNIEEQIELSGENKKEQTSTTSSQDEENKEEEQTSTSSQNEEEEIQQEQTSTTSSQEDEETLSIEDLMEEDLPETPRGATIEEEPEFDLDEIDIPETPR